MTGPWLHIVAAAHAAQALSWIADGVTVQRVTGGNNNALYRVETDGQAYACKLCVADERRRAWREYESLRALSMAGLDIAPEPLWLDESCQIVPYPAVAYRWQPGEPLGPSLTDAQLVALLASVQWMHSLRPQDYPDLPDSIFHWFDFSRYVSELELLLNQYGPWLAATDPDGSHLRDRLAQLVDSCMRLIATTRVKPDRACVALRLCRADTNLANAIWGCDGKIRWVDWEYSGWGDPALELAETRWHASMTELRQEQYIWLRQNYRRPTDDDSFEARLAVWDRLITTRWAFLILRALWSAHNGPDRLRLSQLALDPIQLHARFIRFIERAEHVAG